MHAVKLKRENISYALFYFRINATIEKQMQLVYITNQLFP